MDNGCIGTYRYTMRVCGHTDNTRERSYSERDRGTAGDRRQWTLRRGSMDDGS